MNHLDCVRSDLNDYEGLIKLLYDNQTTVGVAVISIETSPRILSANSHLLKTTNTKNIDDLEALLNDLHILENFQSLLIKSEHPFELGQLCHSFTQIIELEAKETSYSITCSFYDQNKVFVEFKAIEES